MLSMSDINLDFPIGTTRSWKTLNGENRNWAIELEIESHEANMENQKPSHDGNKLIRRARGCGIQSRELLTPPWFLLQRQLWLVDHWDKLSHLIARNLQESLTT